MKNRFESFLHLCLLFVLIAGVVFQPQYAVYAAANMTVTPITWNVVGLDSNDVNAGPNNFPVGARVCNTSTAGETLTNVNADFVWDDGLASDPYINLRSGSQDPINIVTGLAAGSCRDYYFEVTVTRSALAYNQTRDYHINVTSTQTGATVFSTPIPREIYVEKLVSQNRNSVTDVKVDGVSVAAGGTMNLLVGNTYTIQLIGATATNGYEQLESFINFPNTIFRVNSVASTYTANAGTDANAATKLYADGCGWVNDPASGTYRSCTGAGKYGGNITITYNITIIGGAGTSQTLNTLIYDFSGSSYHYNSDFSTSSRIAVISDPATCTQTNITQWTFTGNVTTPATGTGTFTAGSSINTQAFPAGSPTNPSLSYQNWSQTEAIGANAYYQFAVPTTGYNAIHFNFNANVSNNAFDKMAIYYSTDGTNYIQFGGTNTLTTAFAPYNSDLSTITTLNSNPNASFRVYGFSADNANRALRIDQVTVTGCALPANMNLVKTATPATYNAVGNVISYNYLITNTGGVALTGITLSDDKSTNESCPATTLAIGASMTCTATYTITQSDLDSGSVTNIATGDSTQTTPITDTETVTAVLAPAIVLTKTPTLNDTVVAPSGVANAGDTITYTFSIQNTGNVTLTGITVTDPLLPTLTCTLASLAPGASASCTATNNVYTLTQADVNAGSRANTATVTGTPPTGPNVTDPDTQTTTLTQSPALTIVKTATPTTYSAVGNVIGYSYLVTNSGNVTLSGPFTVTDDRSTDEACPATATLAPGASITCTASYTITNTDITNASVTNIASAHGSFGGNPVDSATDTETVTLASAPAIVLTKTPTLNDTVVAPSGVANAGDTITYTFSIQNTGNVTLTGITVTDPLLPTLTCTLASLAPGASASCTATNNVYTLTQADVNAGSRANTATVTGTPPTGPNVTDPDTQTTTLTQSPALTIVKTATPTTYNAVGNVIGYSYLVTNSGNVTLSGPFTVTDDRSTDEACPATATLAPGASITCTASYTITQADLNSGSVTNIASVTNGTITSPTDTETVAATAALIADPALSKAGNPTQASVGETVTFTLTVTNNGNAPAPNVVITDLLPAMFDVTAVNVSGAPFGTSVNVTPAIGVGLAPYTVVVTLGGDLNITDVVTITIVTTVNSLGNPPITNTASLTTSAQTNIISNDADSVTITVRTPTSVAASLPATGFAPNVKTNIPLQPQSFAYAATDLLLEIPSLGVKMPIAGIPKKNGSWDVTWLSKQAGWLEGTAFPSWNGNSVLTGHVYDSNGLPGPFVNLNKLKYGDKIIIHAYGQKYMFEVHTNQVVAPNDISAFKHEEKPWLTLITCKEYDAKTNTYKKRVVVRAVLVSVDWDK